MPLFKNILQESKSEVINEGNGKRVEKKKSSNSKDYSEEEWIGFGDMEWQHEFRSKQSMVAQILRVQSE